MNDDLIKRNDAIKALGEEPYVWTDDEFTQGERSQWINDMNALKAVPSANRPQGKWIYVTIEEWVKTGQDYGRGNCWYEYECSECGFRNKESKSNYCPNCGAHMKGADNE